MAADRSFWQEAEDLRSYLRKRHTGPAGPTVESFRTLAIRSRRLPAVPQPDGIVEGSTGGSSDVEAAQHAQAAVDKLRQYQADSGPAELAKQAEAELAEAVRLHNGEPLDRDSIERAADALTSADTPTQPAGRGKRSTKRRTPEVKPLTAKQAEAVQIVGECNGNIPKAARQLGRDRATVAQHYRAAMAKLGKEAVKHATKAVPSDRRGNEDVADIDDGRREIDNEEARRYRRR